MTAICEQVTEGVVRLGTDQVNFFLVADRDGVTLVDAGAPRYRPHLDRGLELLGRKLDDVKAVVLTHADGDHRGFSEPLREEIGVPVYVHSADADQAKGGPKETESRILPYLRYPQAWKLLAAFTAGGKPPPLKEVSTFEDGDTLEVPGRPRAILVPGHTAGSVVLHFERHGALFLGDVIFFFNVLTGRPGPQIGPSALNADSAQALASLVALEGVEADVLLSGHGDPWRDGVAAAVAAARAAGTS